MFTNFFKSFGVGSRTGVLLSPLSGYAIPLSDVQDQAFAKGLLGQGLAIVPTGNRVVAPADGKIESIFPTGHAVAMHTVDGFDILIHIGMDTVKLDGRHFKVNASLGDTVQKGDVLIEFDREAIAAEGYDVTVPVLICNSAEYVSIKGCEGIKVEELDKLMTARAR